ncbi:MAG: hypothetical protein RR585_09015 [Coprobacillus sp.]
MIQVSTYIGILVCFFATVIITEKYYKKHIINIRLRKMIGYIALYMFALLTLVVLIPQVFPILIYGSVVMSSFFTVYNRHRKLPGEIA